MAASLRGQLAGLPRVNCWTIAEDAGECCPRGMRRLLSSAVWDETGSGMTCGSCCPAWLRTSWARTSWPETRATGSARVWPSTRRLTCARVGRRARSASTPAPRGGRRTPRSPSTGLCRRGGVRVHRPGPVPAPVLDVRPAPLLAPLDHPCLLACAFLAVLAAVQPGGSQPRADQLISLTCHEIRKLFTGRCQQPPDPGARLRWSRWRRRHQATARACHYRRRALAPTCSRSLAGILG